MKKNSEIGSEFWDVPTKGITNNLFPESTQWFLSGRSALQAIIEDTGPFKTVAMPSWICDSVIKPFCDANIDVNFYPVYLKDGLNQETRLDCDAIMLMDYFGYTASQPDLGDYKGIVIRDVTHSIFSNTYSDADYYFGSLRKWCGVWTGGYIWTKDGHQLPMRYKEDFGYSILRQEAMEMKTQYIRGLRSDKEYLDVFSKAEECLEKTGMLPASDRDVRIAKQLDVDSIKSIRRNNAEILRSAFPDWLIFKELKENECPMFVPIIVPNGKRNELRRFLINNDIYCPIHWPVTQFHKLDEREEYIYENELSLVCDQRYTETDMIRMVDAIRFFMGDT